MKNLKNGWKEYWNTRVKSNQQYYGKNKRNSDNIINILNIVKKDKVLDIGCATGAHLSDILDKTKSSCYGIDISPIPIRLNKDKRINLKLGDMKKIPFKNNFFTKIFALGTVEHSPDTLNIFKEMNRVLEKHGRIFITVPNKISFFHITKNIKMMLGKWDLGYEKSFGKKELEEVLDSSGFKLEKLWIEPHLTIANPFNLLDNILNKLNNKKFGFFIYFTATKIKNA